MTKKKAETLAEKIKHIRESSAGKAIAARRAEKFSGKTSGFSKQDLELLEKQAYAKAKATIQQQERNKAQAALHESELRHARTKASLIRQIQTAQRQAAESDRKLQRAKEAEAKAKQIAALPPSKRPTPAIPSKRAERIKTQIRETVIQRRVTYETRKQAAEQQEAERIRKLKGAPPRKRVAPTEKEKPAVRRGGVAEAQRQRALRRAKALAEAGMHTDAEALLKQAKLAEPEIEQTEEEREKQAISDALETKPEPVQRREEAEQKARNEKYAAAAAAKIQKRLPGMFDKEYAGRAEETPVTVREQEELPRAMEIISVADTDASGNIKTAKEGAVISRKKPILGADDDEVTTKKRELYEPYLNERGQEITGSDGETIYRRKVGIYRRPVAGPPQQIERFKRNQQLIIHADIMDESGNVMFREYGFSTMGPGDYQGKRAEAIASLKKRVLTAHPELYHQFKIDDSDGGQIDQSAQGWDNFY